MTHLTDQVPIYDFYKFTENKIHATPSTEWYKILFT